jgi:hypothetical protein
MMSGTVRFAGGAEVVPEQGGVVASRVSDEHNALHAESEASVGSATAALLGRVRDLPEAAFADALLQPVEYSYTVESLTQMAASCGLEVLLPCIDAYSKAAGKTSWNLEFEDPELEALYLALPDARRWHVTNLLLGEESPLLWFYLQRRDSPHPRRSEAEICEDFLRARLVGSKTTRTVNVRAGDGTYRKGERPLPFPGRHPLARQVFEALDPEQPIGGTLARLGLPGSFPVVNRLRIHLTTTAFPFLQVC